MKTKQINKLAPEINMIPMIDVIMMLLIFFLVATQMKKEQDTWALQLPDSVKAAVDKLPPVPAPVTVNIDSPEHASLDKRFVIESIPMTKQEMLLTLQAQSLRARERAGTEGEDTVVRIRADRNSLLEDLQTVLIGCQQAKIFRVYIAADKPPM